MKIKQIELILLSSILLCSCMGNESYPFHYWILMDVVDEVNSTIYYSSYIDENGCLEVINEANKDLVDCFDVNIDKENYYHYKTFVEDDYLYYFAFENPKEEKDESDRRIFYNYKRIGDINSVYDSMQKVEGSLNYVYMNQLKFLIFSKNIYHDDNSFWKNYYDVEMVSYNYLQNGYGVNRSSYNNCFYTSLDDINKIYMISIEDEISIISFDETKEFKHQFPQEIKDAKYINYTKWDEFLYGQVNENYYHLLNHTTKLMNDDCLYFAYCRELGEFKRRSNLNQFCFIKNMMCEILKFDPSLGMIESVSIIPESYNVLGIYKDHAVVMNDKKIASYYYKTKEFHNIVEIDIEEYLDEHNKYQNVVFYLTNENFEFYEIFDIKSTDEK